MAQARKNFKFTLEGVETKVPEGNCEICRKPKPNEKLERVSQHDERLACRNCTMNIAPYLKNTGTSKHKREKVGNIWV